MIIKEADEKKSQIATLEALAARRDASPDVRKRIEQEIRNIRSGIKGEEEAAYEINFHFGASKNYAVIHDLRIEVEGRVAQIDHLLIGRFLDIWVCETKSFCEGIAINEQGECSRFYNNKPSGMASPFEQNKKHIMVLGSLFKTGMVQLPTRLGFSIKPNMTSVVLVSKNARISRPKTKIAGVESIIKSDQFRSMIDRATDGDNNPLTMAKTDRSRHAGKLCACHRRPAQADCIRLGRRRSGRWRRGSASHRPLGMAVHSPASNIQWASGVRARPLRGSSLPLTACWWMWAAWTMEVVSVSRR
jgi:hypothetical protein